MPRAVQQQGLFVAPYESVAWWVGLDLSGWALTSATQRHRLYENPVLKPLERESGSGVGRDLSGTCATAR
jgi:hypothetical protein